MRRRELLLSATAMMGTRAVRAQQRAMPVIGHLSSTSLDATAPMVAAFGRGLGELGYVDGWNVTIKYRWAEGHYDRLPALAAELVDRKVDLIARHSSGLGGEKRDLDDPNRLQRQRPG